MARLGICNMHKLLPLGDIGEDTALTNATAMEQAWSDSVGNNLTALGDKTSMERLAMAGQIMFDRSVTAGDTAGQVAARLVQFYSEPGRVAEQCEKYITINFTILLALGLACRIATSLTIFIRAWMRQQV
jgi:putative Ca2+/H+ antiporter (TMEM165/GDT1 family)